MELEQIKEKLKTDEYSFLKTDKNLGDNIILLTLGGSHAYGTNTEGSDLDIRGCTLNSREDLLRTELFQSDKKFTQFDDPVTDTVIYSFNKLVRLLAECNPNTIEILGCKPEHYLYLSPIGKELIEKTSMFLSKKVIYTFGGYATAQMYRLSNKANRYVGQEELEEHILKTLKNVSVDFPEKYFDTGDGYIRLYIDDAVHEEYEKEIFMDVCLKHYPLRDWNGMWSELQSIAKSYNKIGKRNKNAILHDKIEKHMMHLIRLYYMCIDILENGEVNTYREKEHDFLMSVRNGEYLDDNNQPTKEFYEIVKKMEAQMKESAGRSKLPDVPDYKGINDFVTSVNERIIKGEI